MSKECLEHCEALLEELETASYLWEYIERDALDIEYTIYSTGELKGASIYFTIGGPTVWIEVNSCSGTIHCHWGVDKEVIGMPGRMAEEIFDFVYELYDNTIK